MTQASGVSRTYTRSTPSFNLLYRSFEDRHRGSSKVIREMQEHDYLDLLSALPHPHLPIVDLGCGRGELVRLLHDRQQRSLGIDSNAGQIAADEPADLLVQEDMFTWLDDRDNASVRAVVSLHVIEHLLVDEQVRLVFEAYRVVAEGGLLLLETPNTLSLSTAATNFWVDPTHQHPVHPMFLEFLAQEAGFRNVETRPMHPIPLSFPTDEAPDLAADLNSLILGSGDLALVAYK